MRTGLAQLWKGMAALTKYYGSYIKKDYAIRKSEDINISSKLSLPLAMFARKNSIALHDIIELVYYSIDLSQEV